MHIDVENPNFILGLMAGAVIGMVAVWSFLYPVIARIIARVLGIGAAGFGMVWLTTAITDMARGLDGTYHSPLGRGGTTVALGWGVGGLAVGVLLIVFSFLSVGPKRPKTETVAGETKTM